MADNTNLNEERPLDHIPADGGFTAIFRTIACVGDSLSSGEFEAAAPDGSSTYHDMYEYSWGQFIARMCGSKVYNFSRGGMTARTYCNSFADEMDYWNPKYASQAYIIALGVNDIGYEKGEVGSTNDIDLNDWHNNTRNFAGYMGEIMQRLREIQPRAKFFLLTMPRENEGDEMRQRKEDHRRFLYELAELFGNTYVIDLFRDAPVYDEAFKKQYYLRGHMNPMGYLQTAKTVAAYIDYIIRKNPDDFREVGFIGTDLHG